MVASHYGPALGTVCIGHRQGKGSLLMKGEWYEHRPGQKIMLRGKFRRSFLGWIIVLVFFRTAGHTDADLFFL